MPCSRWFGVVTLMLLFSLAPVWAQRAPVPVPPPNAPNEHTELDQDMRRTMQRERLKKRAEDMKRDSQKLLELATELKRYVDKAGENFLSLEVLRKAEEMEKLARQVKNNMRSE
jgi:hypothetical protein